MDYYSGISSKFDKNLCNRMIVCLMCSKNAKSYPSILYSNNN